MFAPFAILVRSSRTIFFFQAEDGIRDTSVTGVQTCALPISICYSVKANSNLSVLRLLGKMGAGFDVVSGGELERVLRANRGAARRVVFSGVGKTEAEIDAALRAGPSGILLFNCESGGEIERL